jgi:Putative DNA-binding domain
MQNPRETLSHELKGWLDPSKDDDKANLIRAVLAMSNHEVGGLIAIGIDDDGKHLPPPQDFSVLTAYNQEAIQQFVSKYASRKFEVEVIFVVHDTVTHPVIVVPPAAEMPIICRSAIGQGSCHDPVESRVGSYAPASLPDAESAVHASD